MEHLFCLWRRRLGISGWWWTTGLSTRTVKNRYPLPCIDDLIDKLFGAQYFSCLDAASGFHQILLKDKGKPKTAFRTPFGHYLFRVHPFGLTNAPATLQAVMNNLFNPPKFNADGSLNPRHKLSEFAIVFIDDTLTSANLLLNTHSIFRW